MTTSTENTVIQNSRVTEDKYACALRFIKAKNFRQALNGCKLLHQWEQQIKFRFGFIPLGELQMPASVNPVSVSMDNFDMHKMIKDSMSSAS